MGDLLDLEDITEPGFFIAVPKHDGNILNGAVVYVQPYHGLREDHDSLSNSASVVVIGGSRKSCTSKHDIGWVLFHKDDTSVRFKPIESASDLPEGFGLPCLSPGEQETARHDKVRAIKMYRNRTECSLRDSKEVVEAYLATWC